VPVLQFQPRFQPRPLKPRFLRACFLPLGKRRLAPELRSAIGDMIEVQFVRLADEGERFEGQALYCVLGHDFLRDWLIPEQDLGFVP
jgi:hypothetical protein